MKLCVALQKSASLLKSQIITLMLVSKHKDTPWYSKALITSVILYALSPIDLIPDFIPVLGYLDELILLPLLVGLAIRLTPAHVLDDCKERAQTNHLSNLHKKSLGGLLVLTIWVIIGGLIYASVSKA